MILQQPIEREQMQKLLATGRTDLLTRFISKKGRPFKAFLVKTPERQDRLRIPAAAPKPGAAAKARRPKAAAEATARSRKTAAARKQARRLTLDVQVAHAERVRLDEGAARLDLVAHQLGEDLVGGDAVLDLHPQQAPRPRDPWWSPTAARDSSRPGPCSAAGSSTSRTSASSQRIASPKSLTGCLLLAALHVGAGADQAASICAVWRICA